MMFLVLHPTDTSAFERNTRPRYHGDKYSRTDEGPIEEGGRICVPLERPGPVRVLKE